MTRKLEELTDEDREMMGTVNDFVDACKSRFLLDIDGHGCPVIDGKIDRGTVILPSNVTAIPENATHIVWFNV